MQLLTAKFTLILNAHPCSWARPKKVDWQTVEKLRTNPPPEWITSPATLERPTNTPANISNTASGPRLRGGGGEVRIMSRRLSSATSYCNNPRTVSKSVHRTWGTLATQDPAFCTRFNHLATPKLTLLNTLRTGLLICLNARSRGLTFRHRASYI